MRLCLVFLVCCACAVVMAEEGPRGPTPEVWDGLRKEVSQHFPIRSSFSGLDRGSLRRSTLGWTIPGFAEAGTSIWEARLRVSHPGSASYCLAVVWHDPVSGRSRTIVRAAAPEDEDEKTAMTTSTRAIDDIRVEQQQIAAAAAAEQAARTALGDALRPDERIAIDPALRVGFSIAGFCDLGAWVWPVRVLAGTDELRGMYWLNAANGVLRPIAARP